MQKLKLIVACSYNGAIGYNNNLLWSLKSDMKRFKELTTANIVIMGRKTFESIGSKPLPNRLNIVISRSEDLFYKYLNVENIYVIDSLEGALSYCKEYEKEKDVYIIGGSEIYKQTTNLVNEVLVTLVHTYYTEYDSYFDICELYCNKQFDLISNEKHFADDKNEFDFSYLHFVSKK